MTLHNCYYFGGHCCHCIQGGVTEETDSEMFINKYNPILQYKHKFETSAGNQKQYILEKRLHENTCEFSNIHDHA